MDIVESWQDDRGHAYAIVRNSPASRKQYGVKAYEALWLDEDGQLFSFGGSPGLRTADFDTLDEARDFLLAGIAQDEHNLDIWLEMLEV